MSREMRNKLSYQYYLYAVDTTKWKIEYFQNLQLYYSMRYMYMLMLFFLLMAFMLIDRQQIAAGCKETTSVYQLFM